MKNDLGRFEGWLARKPKWVSVLGLVGSIFLLGFNLAMPDPLPVIDELTLFGLVFVFAKALLRRKEG